jgi:hypothetical protein
MRVRLVTIGTLVITFIILLGFGTSVRAHTILTTDFSFFDNTNPASPSQGIQCSARTPFEYHVTVSDFSTPASPNVLRVTYADGDFVRFKIAADGTQQISGFARGGNVVVNDFPDRCISICAETAGKLAGQMSVKTEVSGNPAIKCNNITCAAGGVAPACPFPF